MPKRNTLLYTRMLKAAYGIIKDDFLFYLNLAKDIKLNCSQMNLSEPCVAKKTTEGEQMESV